MFGLLAVSIFFIIKLTHAALSIEAGSYVPKMGAIYYAHNLLPIGVILLFLGTQHFNWPEKISDFSKFTFGTYLMHPAVIDIIDIFLKGVELAPYQLVLFKYTLTLSVVLALSIIISKIPFLAWTIGLGPLPFTNRTSKKLTSKKLTSKDDTDEPKVASTN